jgi:hypothetical protein
MKEIQCYKYWKYGFAVICCVEYCHRDDVVLICERMHESCIKIWTAPGNSTSDYNNL